MSSQLERAISRFRPRDGHVDVSRVSAAAFRAMVLERLRSVERDVADVKSRVSGLIFLVVGAVISQLILKLVA